MSRHQPAAALAVTISRKDFWEAAIEAGVIGVLNARCGIPEFSTSPARSETGPNQTGYGVFERSGGISIVPT